MKQTKSLPNVSYLHKRFDYNAVSGELRWLPKDESGGNTRQDNPERWNHMHAYQIAGCRGYKGRVVRLDEVIYKVHRIIWKMTHGEDPKGEIDHINRDPFDNRINNLRLATYSENRRNTGLLKRNTSGVTGVYWNWRVNKWVAFIHHDGKSYNLGGFDSKEDAHKVRLEKELELHKEFSPNWRHFDLSLHLV